MEQPKSTSLTLAAERLGIREVRDVRAIRVFYLIVSANMTDLPRSKSTTA